MDYFDPIITGIIAEVLGELNNTDANGYVTILDDIEDKQKQSIEDFSERVYEYIKSKPKGFRLNFFVDEIGQYISDNTKLMLNLQTIAETLATKTKGNSWIFVTSQEDMEKVVGDMNKSQQNDFSRIQARFNIKIPLTSANVDEVVEKRLLKKTAIAQQQLATSYEAESAHLESLLSFSEAGIQFKGFHNAIDFGNKFPFIPYQFDLFQQCRRSLSTHNAFQGKHSSVGERSMLGVFQQVIKKMSEKNENSLVSFDLMYEGIRKELRGEIQKSVILAERLIDNKFAIQVLKALFLVKYFGNFKTTKRNISVLLINDIKIDIKQHEKKIEEALNTLENQSYVQRNGDVYEFLTDDEKDVEEEIKETDIDEQAITQLLREIFFDEIIRDNKIKFIENKQDYSFTSKIDGVILGREKELEIEIITENYENYDYEVHIKTSTMRSAGMILLLASNAVFMKDLKMYLRTDKYVKQNQTTSNRIEVKRILQDKAHQNTERRRNLILLANKSLAEATVYMNGSKYEMGQTKDGKTRVVQAFQGLIKITYPNLRMLGTHYNEDSIKSAIRTKLENLFGSDDKTISEPESEILNLVKRRKQQTDRTSLQDVKNYFTKKPYGWYPNAIWTNVAKLYKRGKIELKQNANLLEDENVLNALLNSSNYINTLLEPQTTINPNQLKKLKQVYADTFDESCPAKEAKDVANIFKDKLKEMSVDVSKLLAQRRDYPFVSSLDDLSELLDKLIQKDYHYYITNLSDFEDKLLDVKEDILAPIKSFMNGDQIKIYDDIKQLINGNTANVQYIDGDEFSTLQTLINSKTPYKGNGIRLGKAAKDSLTKKVLDAIKKEKEVFISKCDELESKIKQADEYSKLKEEQQKQILQPFIDKKREINNERFIGNIKNAVHDIEEVLYNKQLNLMAKWLVTKTHGNQVVEPKVRYISSKTIRVAFDKNELTTEDDVNNYLDALKEAYMERINQNLKITL